MDDEGRSQEELAQALYRLLGDSQTILDRRNKIESLVDSDNPDVSDIIVWLRSHGVRLAVNSENGSVLWVYRKIRPKK